MTFSVTVLGTSSALPTLTRHPSAQLVNHHHHYLLLDCGEGTQMQLQRYGLKRSKIEHIFISHLHGDHFFGLPGLLTSLNLLGHKKPLHLYGPPALYTILEVLFGDSLSLLQLTIHFHPIDATAASLLLDNEALTVHAIPLQHRIACTGFIIEEKIATRPYLPEMGKKYGVPVAAIADIKRGNDFVQPNGTVIPHTLLTGSPPPPRKYVYFSDTAPIDKWDLYIAGANLLYHEATFMEIHKARAIQTHHSTAAQAASVAKRTAAHQLMIGHYSAKYNDLQPLLKEAQAVFPNTVLAEEGCTYTIA